jgi:hypothetical protein
VLDWRPAIQLREGLAKTIAYFDQLLQGGRARDVAAAAL